MALRSSPVSEEHVEPISAPASIAGTMTPFRSFLHKYFYFSMALLCIAIKVLSVLHSPSYTVDDVHHDSVFHPDEARPWILWLHNAVFSAWLAFFVFQSGLVHTHKVKWHRFFGWFGGLLGAAMVLIGIATAIVRGREGTAMLMGTEAEAYLIVPFYNMLAFCVFCALAVLWRKKPKLHRQLIFFATCGLLDTAFLRFEFIFNHRYFFPCIDLLIVLGILCDLYVNRRVHRVYLIGLPVLIVSQAFVTYTWMNSSVWWLRIAHAIIG
jgi:hypothetical protein